MGSENESEYLKIKQNEPFEVNSVQYKWAKDALAGAVATRISGWWFWKSYYVKLWLMGFEIQLRQILYQADPDRLERYFK